MLGFKDSYSEICEQFNEIKDKALLVQDSEWV